MPCPQLINRELVPGTHRGRVQGMRNDTGGSSFATMSPVLLGADGSQEIADGASVRAAKLGGSIRHDSRGVVGAEEGKEREGKPQSSNGRGRRAVVISSDSARRSYNTLFAFECHLTVNHWYREDTTNDTDSVRKLDFQRGYQWVICSELIVRVWGSNWAHYAPSLSKPVSGGALLTQNWADDSIERG